MFWDLNIVHDHEVERNREYQHGQHKAVDNARRCPQAGSAIHNRRRVLGTPEKGSQCC